MDLGPVVNALPFSNQTKVTILTCLPLAYALLAVLRHFVPPASKAGQIISSITGGWKHPDEVVPLVKEQIEDKKAAKAEKTPPAALLALLVAGSLLFATAARAASNVDEGIITTPPLPTTLCAIGSQGNWCFGLLPTVTTAGVDVKNGVVVGGLSVGASLAATWMPGQLKSVTIGVHTGFNVPTGAVPQTYSIGGTISFLKGWGTIITDWQIIGGTHAFVIAPALGIPL